MENKPCYVDAALGDYLARDYWRQLENRYFQRHVQVVAARVLGGEVRSSEECKNAANTILKCFIERDIGFM